MISKNLISEIRSLHQSKFRKSKNLFIAEGEKVVEELLKSSFAVREIFATPEYLEQKAGSLSGITSHTVSITELERLSMLSTPNKVVAVVNIPEEKPFRLNLKNDYSLALDGIRDPGNLGTILRTADWFGIQDIFCSEDTVDCFNPKVVQGAMGSLFRLNVLYGDLKSLPVNNDVPFISASLDGQNIHNITWPSKAVIIMGSESHGISSELTDSTLMNIKIPSHNSSGAESLNVAVATGIILSYLRK
jgi:RNA methyltransferase, TrmH family